MTMSFAIFLVTAAFLAFAVAGYPLLLVAILRYRGGKPVLKRFEPRSVDVILPVRNAVQWIGPKLDSLLALEYPRDLLRIIVVSDESTDGTDDVVREYAVRHPIELIRVPQGGKTPALNAAFNVANGEILFFTDVRQRIDAHSLKELVSCFADPAVGVVSGELFITSGDSREAKDVSLYWRYEKWIRKHLCAIDSFHGATGCIYAMRRQLAEPLPPATLNDDMYLPLVALLAGYRVIFEENARAYDFATELDVEFRRKVRTLAGVLQIVRLLPATLTPKNRMWFHFLSHKIARLLMPYAMAVFFVISFLIPEPWNLLAVGAQLMFYFAAAMDPAVPRRSLLKRITAPARTFVVLMVASLFAASILFVPPQSLWKPTNIANATPARQERS